MSRHDSKYFSTTKKGEIPELKEELNSQYKEKRKDVVKKVIAAMTVGKDVLSLFTDVANCMQTEKFHGKEFLLANLHRKRGELVTSQTVLSEMIEKGLKPNFAVYVKVMKHLQKSGEDLARNLESSFSSFISQPCVVKELPEYHNIEDGAESVSTSTPAIHLKSMILIKRSTYSHQLTEIQKYRLLKKPKGLARCLKRAIIDKHFKVAAAVRIDEIHKFTLYCVIPVQYMNLPREINIDKVRTWKPFYKLTQERLASHMVFDKKSKGKRSRFGELHSMNASLTVDVKWTGAPVASMLHRHRLDYSDADDSILKIVFVLLSAGSDVKQVKYSSSYPAALEEITYFRVFSLLWEKSNVPRYVFLLFWIEGPKSILTVTVDKLVLIFQKASDIGFA
ncbi:putative transcription factor KAN2-like [Hibiscus syriacus]|uniref:Transcription factor KAN2-like n=1 Tax=Hibiscus syriacus TaxID=106335 RepID=A0A6A3CUK5_HIBSY|nr:putative transcription factor KAN2-like [Hibiscus syriacus]